MTESIIPALKESIKGRLRVPFLVILVVATAAVGFLDLSNYIKDREARKWVAVPAQVTRVDATATVQLKDPYFSVQLEYKYRFGDKEYKGNRVTFIEIAPMLGYDMGRFVNRYKVGQTVIAMVQPGTTDNVVLESDPNFWEAFCHFIAIAVLSAILYLSTFPVVRETMPA